ncbi:MAG: hypothetical protein QXF35_00865 [Candidatus Bilamarchaeaceae archaeon]
MVLMFKKEERKEQRLQRVPELDIKIAEGNNTNRVIGGAVRVCCQSREAENNIREAERALQIKKNEEKLGLDVGKLVKNFTNFLGIKKIV